MTMKGELDVKGAIKDYFEASKIYEFPIVCYSRQGGRTGAEVLARAFAMTGKNVYIGTKLAARSRGTNQLVLRIADTEDIPRGVALTYSRGLLAMHEDLYWPIPVFRGMSRSEIVSKSAKGTLMVCTSKSPEEIEYPLDFEGTIATVDAEGIFNARIGKEPATSGVTALGLFVAATKLIGIDTVKDAILQHDRLPKKVREANAACMVEAYEKSKVLNNVKLKGKYTPEQFAAKEAERPQGDFMTVDDMTAQTWRSKLPVCDTRKCVCIECLAAYYCGVGALSWKDEQFCLDYDFCKGCGTCEQECPEKAIKMESAEKVLAEVKK